MCETPADLFEEYFIIDTVVQNFKNKTSEEIIRCAASTLHCTVATRLQLWGLRIPWYSSKERDTAIKRETVGKYVGWKNADRMQNGKLIPSGENMQRQDAHIMRKVCNEMSKGQ